MTTKIPLLLLTSNQTTIPHSTLRWSSSAIDDDGVIADIHVPHGILLMPDSHHRSYQAIPVIRL